MANDLKIGITADASSLDATMDKATATLDDFQKAAGNSAEKIEILSKALGDAQAAGLRGDEAFGAAVTTLREMEAQAEATAAAADALAAAETEVAASSQRMVSGTVAANGAMRVLEGSMWGGTRAAASFVSTTLGLGPILEAAFPVIGAAALGMVIFDIGKELGKFSEEASELANKLNIGWLDGAIAEMAGLGDVVKQTDKELLKLAEDGDAIQSSLNRDQIRLAEMTGGSAAGKFEEVTQLQQRYASLGALLPVIGADIANINAQLAVNPATGTSKAQDKGGMVEQLKTQQELIQAKAQYNGLLNTQREIESRIFTLNAEAVSEQTKSPKASKGSKSGGANKDDEVEFSTDRLMAEEAIKEQTKLDDAKKKSDEDTFRAMIQDAETYAAESERINDALMKNFLDADHKELEDYNKKIQAQEKAADKFHKEQEQKAKKAADEEQKDIEKVESEFNKSVDAWLTGSEKMSKAWTEMGDHMAIDIINTLMKIGEKWLAHEALITAKHLFGIAERKAADSSASAAEIGTAAATQAAIAATKAAAVAGNAAEAESYAGLAAVEAAAEAAPAGPLAAAAAGTEMYASLSPFVAAASYDVGTDYVPRSGMAMIHEGERIIPSSQNQQITQALSSRGRQGGDSHYHYSPQISGIDGASVAGMARQHGNMFLRQAGRQMRLMGRSQG